MVTHMIQFCLSDMESDDKWITEKGYNIESDDKWITEKGYNMESDDEPCLLEDTSWMDIHECFEVNEE